MTSRKDKPTAARGLLEAVDLRPVGIDDWSAVRHLHILAFRKLVSGDDEIAATKAFTDLASEPEYTEHMMREALVSAWLQGELLGTCGWLPADDRGNVARLTGLFVNPLFTRLGVGSRLLGDVERQVRSGGFRQITARTAANGVAFFALRGYELSAQGVTSLGGVYDLPVAFVRKTL